jgi:hypothetical protein
MKRLALLIAIVLVSLVWMVGVSQSADQGIPGVISQLKLIQQQLDALTEKVNANTPKTYYLTLGTFKGGEALSACDSAHGFHMASLFEILDPTTLRYDQDATRAFQRADQGAGPPSDVLGWVRTGYDTVRKDVVGLANCGSDQGPWTSNDLSDDGSAVELYAPWLILTSILPTIPEQSFSRPNVPWWRPVRTACNDPDIHVWCVEGP